jgi:HD-GYP domain-containing protein (c-di-GMP phosphodiesterase class II)
MGVVVHDIGNVALRPGEGADSDCAELSVHILAPLGLPAIVMDMARHHADRYDGTGNRGGLSLEEIPLAARIVAVARAFDQNTQDPSPHAFDGALHDLRMTAGTRVCPRVVAALTTCLDRDPALRRYFGSNKDVTPHAA